jgi:hypothetical protein
MVRTTRSTPGKVFTRHHVQELFPRYKHPTCQNDQVWLLVEDDLRDPFIIVAASFAWIAFEEWLKCEVRGGNGWVRCFGTGQAISCLSIGEYKDYGFIRQSGCALGVDEGL